MYPTHLIYQAMGKPAVESEPCNGICAFCGTEIQEGVKLENSVSDAFTNFDMLIDSSASHVCKYCNACLREPKLRRMNFIATEQEIIYFRHDDIGKWLFESIPMPFVISITESMKKHASFKARVNLSNKIFYVQKEDEQILFSPGKYKDVYEAMKRLYLVFSKKAIAIGNYKIHLIKKYGVENFKRDEAIIKDSRGTQQFELLLYSMNMTEEQLKKFKERKAKQEDKLHGMRAD